MPKPWGVFACYHILPLEDKLVHKFAEECPCRPKIEEHPHSAGWIITHNALDRRPNWAPELLQGGKLAD